MGAKLDGTVAGRLVPTDDLPALPLTASAKTMAGSLALRASADYDLSRGPLTRIRDSSALAGDRVAVGDARARLSYAGLLDRVDRLTAALRPLALEGRPVAVAGPRCCDTVVALLALEALGAVYVPVDQSWPEARIGEVLRDVDPPVVLQVGHSDDVSAAPSQAAQTAAIPLFDVSALSVTSIDVSAPAWRPRDIAYVLFTSGSSGRPKGAAIERVGLLNHLWAKVEDLALRETDVVAQTAPVSFDISLWQLLAVLLVGGRVEIFDERTVRDPARLGEACRRRGVTVLELVPAVLRVMLEASRGPESPLPLPALRVALATGEELPPAVAREWFRHCPGTPLVNAYGPTECADDVTHHVLASPPAADSSTVPIGTPIGNTQLYVLSETAEGWEPCPAGAPGELFVGGTGVGRGYLDRPVETRAAFFRNTLMPSDGPRLYKTGDLVRVANGSLEFLGRVDRQVKRHGVRLELGEVEAVLDAHPAIQGCVTTFKSTEARRSLVARRSEFQRDAAESIPQLIAYYRSANPLPAAVLREHAAARLPQGAVPDNFVFVEAFPLTSNGKVDRDRLPAPPPYERVVAFDRPRSDVERLVCDLWAQLLDIPEVGRDDRFDDLGGSSLHAMQMVAELRRRGYAQLSVVHVTPNITPAGLAAQLEAQSQASAAEQPAGLVGDGSGDADELGLSAAQTAIFVQWRLAPDSPYYSYQGALHLNGALDVPRLQAAWAQVLEAHPQLTARFSMRRGRPRQQFGAWPQEPLPILELAGRAADEQEAAFDDLARHAAAEPFDLLDQRLLRAMLVRFSDQHARLLLTTHEILLDGWAATLLMQRLGAAYASGAVAVPASAEAGAYLRWERQLRASPEHRRATTYWARQLTPPPTPLRLPEDRPSPSPPTHRGEVVETLVSPSVVDALRATCHRRGMTEFGFFIGAFAAALAGIGETDEVTIGIPFAGRERPEQIDVVAFLLNMLPIRISTTGEQEVARYLAEVQAQLSGAYAAAICPFATMLQAAPADIRRGTATTPVFRAMVNMLNYPQRHNRYDEVTFDFIELETGFTKYAYSLYVQPHPAGSRVLQLAYESDRFDRSTATDLLEATRETLEGLVHCDPTRQLFTGARRHRSESKTPNRGV